MRLEFLHRRQERGSLGDSQCRLWDIPGKVLIDGWQNCRLQSVQYPWTGGRAFPVITPRPAFASAVGCMLYINEVSGYGYVFV